MPKISPKIIIYIVVVIALMVAMYMLCSPNVEEVESNPDDIVELFKAEGGYVKITNDSIEAHIDSKKYTAEKPDGFNPSVLLPLDIESDEQLEMAYGDERDSSSGGWLTMIFNVLPFILIGLLFFLIIRRMGSRPQAPQ